MPRDIPEFLAPPVGAPTTVAVLRSARAFVEKGWCRKPFAEKVDGSAIWILHDAQLLAEGTCFCAIGAVHRAAGLGQWRAEGFLDKAARVMGYHRAIDLNDKTDQATVLRMYDAAIALAEAEAAHG